MCSQGFTNCHAWWLGRSRHRDPCRPVIAGFRFELSYISSIECLHSRLDTSPHFPHSLSRLFPQLTSCYLTRVPHPGTGLSSNLRRGGRRPFASGTPAVKGRAQQRNIDAATGSSWLVWEPIPKPLTGTLSVDSLSGPTSILVRDFFSIECDLSQFAFALTVILAKAGIYRGQNRV